MFLFKVLDASGKTYQDRQHEPAIDVELPELHDVVLCERGYHACINPLPYRGTIPWAEVRVWLVELGGEIQAEGDKVAAGRMKWVQEVPDDWVYLPLFPALKVMLASRWRAQHPDQELPAWAYLGGADLGGANLGDAYLGGADLRDAYLRDAYLRDADLGGANLRDANLGGAYLGGAYLGGADLGDADLGDANLGGADLGGWERGEDGFARRKQPVAETS